MSEINRLRLACCLIGAVVWAQQGWIMCLIRFEAPDVESVGVEAGQLWAKTITGAQVNAASLSSVCGALLGLAACMFFERRPPGDHVKAGPKLMTRAEALTTLLTVLLGAGVSLAITAVVLPQLQKPGILVPKPLQAITIPSVAGGGIVSGIIFPVSLKVVRMLSRKKQRLNP
jgi:hypothetical protein